jgi:hypothetical protein
MRHDRSNIKLAQQPGIDRVRPIVLHKLRCRLSDRNLHLSPQDSGRRTPCRRTREAPSRRLCPRAGVLEKLPAAVCVPVLAYWPNAFASPLMARSLMQRANRLQVWRLSYSCSSEPAAYLAQCLGYAAWTRGLRERSGSARRRTSRVTGATSPTPRKRKRKKLAAGLPSVHSR